MTRRRRRVLAGIGWLAALLLATLVGYAAAPALLSPPTPPDDHEQLVQDQGLLERLRLYRHVDDVIFLRELDRPELFGVEPGMMGGLVPGQPMPSPSQADPTRLRANLTQFRALPAERQTAIRQLDRDLQAADPSRRAELEMVMARYADWIDLLPPADRDRVVSAVDRHARMEIIREIRDRQWLTLQPKATRVALEKADPKTRGERIRQLQQAERDQRADWRIAERNWELLLRNPGGLPSRPEQLPAETREYLDRDLRPLLSRADEQRLSAAQGQWPRYPRLLVELADAHPPSLLGPFGPLRIADLPVPVQDLVLKERLPGLRGIKDKMKEAEGKWPDFGLALRDLNDKVKPFRRDMPITAPRWMPAEPRNFPADVQEFIQRELLPALSSDERRVLESMAGIWPNYPRTVLDLSRKHNLRPPPGKTMPGLDRYR